MKKHICVILALACIFMLVLSGCGGNEQGPSEAEGGNKTTPSYVIKFGHGSAESNARHKAALKFKELVEAKSNGDIKVEVYPNEVLGSEREMLENVQLNNIQMTAAGTGIFAGFYPKIGVIELPYIFETFEQAWKVLDGPVGAELTEPLKDKGIRVLAFWENGFRHVTNNVRPINHPSDLAGLKIRVPEIPVTISIFKHLGANATPLPFGEVYMALQQKTVDGQENPYTNIYASKLYEVQKYLSQTKHQYSPLPLAISEEFWKTLPKEYQDIIQEAANEARDYHRSLIKEDDEALVSELEKEGVIINAVPDIEPFRKAVEPVYAEFEDTFGRDLIEKLKNAAAEAR